MMLGPHGGLVGVPPKRTHWCKKCRVTIFPMDPCRILDGLIYHDRCAKCERCEVPLDQATFAPPDKQGVLLCKTHYLEREQAGKAADKCKNTQTKKQSFLLRSPRLQQQTPAPVAAAAVRPAPESPVRPAVALAEQEEEQPTAVVEVVAAEAEPAGVSLLLEGRAEEGKGLEEEEKELDCAKEGTLALEEQEEGAAPAPEDAAPAATAQEVSIPAEQQTLPSSSSSSLLEVEEEEEEEADDALIKRSGSNISNEETETLFPFIKPTPPSSSLSSVAVASVHHSLAVVLPPTTVQEASAEQEHEQEHEQEKRLQKEIAALEAERRELDGAKRLQHEQQRQLKLQEQQGGESGGSMFGWVQARKQQWKERERVAAAQRGRERREGELMERERALRRELQRLKKGGQATKAATALAEQQEEEKEEGAVAAHVATPLTLAAL